MPIRELFIISIQRSGSNWLHRCLAQHPDVTINGEVNPSAALLKLDSIKAGDAVAQQKLRDSGAYHRAAQNYIISLLCENADINPGQRDGLLVDKTAFPCVISLTKHPEQFRYSEILDDYFPEAKKILLIRDVRDVIVSFSEWKKQRLGSLLKLTPRSGLFFWRFLSNWCVLHKTWLDHIEKSNQWLVFSYKDMKTDFNGTLKKVFKFLELPADDKFLLMLEEKLYSINSPVYKKENEARGYGFFRKGALGEWQEKFSWWHKLIFNIFFNHKVNNIYKKISSLNKS